MEEEENNELLRKSLKNLKFRTIHDYITNKYANIFVRYLRKLLCFLRIEKFFKLSFNFCAVLLISCINFTAAYLVNKIMLTIFEIIGSLFNYEIYFKIVIFHLILMIVCLITFLTKLTLIYVAFSYLISTIIYYFCESLTEMLNNGYYFYLVSILLFGYIIEMNLNNNKILFVRIIKKSLTFHFSVFVKKLNISNDSERMVCCICNQKINGKTYLALCNLNHSFHKNCLIQNYNSLNLCPTCNHNIFWFPYRKMLIDLSSRSIIRFRQPRARSSNSPCIIYNPSNITNNFRNFYMITPKNEIIKINDFCQNNAEYICKINAKSWTFTSHANYFHSIYLYNAYYLENSQKYDTKTNRLYPLPKFPHRHYLNHIGVFSHYLFAQSFHDLNILDLLDEEAGWIALPKEIIHIYSDSYSFFDIGNNFIVIICPPYNSASIINLVRKTSSPTEFWRIDTRDLISLPKRGIVSCSSNPDIIQFYWVKLKTLIIYN